MIVWSPSSYALWKQCPVKYKIKKIERWEKPSRKRDHYLMRLAVPGLVVDQLIQLWFHRSNFNDTSWLHDNFEMVWNKVISEIRPKWDSDEELLEKIEETKSGLTNAVKLLQPLKLYSNKAIVQPSFLEQITDLFSITGAADLILTSMCDGTSIIVDLKNAYNRNKVTKEQLILYQIGIEKKYGLDISKVGYCLFNQRVNDWKWFKINEKHKTDLMLKLNDATDTVLLGEFKHNWNFYDCPRFCDARFGCDKFMYHYHNKRNRK